MEDLTKALEVLKHGGIILYPTETIWGIGCDATCSDAVERIFRLKGRADSKAMISLVDSMESLQKWVRVITESVVKEIEDSARPLTVVYENPMGIAPRLIAEDGSAAFRITSLPFTRELCRQLGRPLVSTSANISGEKPAATFAAIDERILEGVDYVCLTGRDNLPGHPSRIVRLSGGTVEVIRE